MTNAVPDLRIEREGVADLAERLRAPRLPAPADRRAIRVAAGATLRDIAAALHVNAMTISRWERGVAEPWPRHRAAYLCLLAALAEIAAELNHYQRVPAPRLQTYAEVMAQDADPRVESTEPLGIPVTDEGKRAARARRLAVNVRRTPERLNAMRAKIGMPPAPAANA